MSDDEENDTEARRRKLSLKGGAAQRDPRRRPV
jgi:hypothetical protein